MTKKNIAILGGAFDPIHNDHLTMAYEVLNFNFSDEVWFTPTPDSRWDKTCFSNTQHRLAMINLATQNERQFSVCTDELYSPEYRGSYYFLSKLKERHPTYNFQLVIGADSYANLPYWRDPKEFTGANFNGSLLMDEFELICFPRPNSVSPDPKKHESSYSKCLKTFDSSPFQLCLGNTSSTEIRNRIPSKKGKGLLPQSVLEYIETHKLYL